MFKEQQRWMCRSVEAAGDAASAVGVAGEHYIESRSACLPFSSLCLAALAKGCLFNTSKDLSALIASADLDDAGVASRATVSAGSA